MAMNCYKNFFYAFLIVSVWLGTAVLLSGFQPKVPTDDIEPTSMRGMTERHNKWRAELGLPPLKWSNKIAAVAQKWANVLKNRGCKMEHSSTKYGENIYWSMGAKRTPQEAVDAWGSEKQYFNFETLTCNEHWSKCGHYTQLIWENTTSVGCAMAYCKDGAEIWVCNYDPPGNYTGQKPYVRKK